jgi:hypothetical protein
VGIYAKWVGLEALATIRAEEHSKPTVVDEREAS